MGKTKLLATVKHKSWFTDYHRDDVGAIRIEFDGLSIDVEAMNSSDPNYPRRDECLINISTGVKLWHGNAIQLANMVLSNSELLVAMQNLVTSVDKMAAQTDIPVYTLESYKQAKEAINKALNDYPY